MHRTPSAAPVLPELLFVSRVRSLLALALLSGCAPDYKVVPEDPVECGVAGGEARYVDGDGDGWAASSCCALTDEQVAEGGFDPDDPNLCPAGAQTKANWEARGGGVSDCNDADHDIHPNNDAESSCDEVDSDCDLATDDGPFPEWSFDGDGDGYGDANLGLVEGCVQPAGYVAAYGDCEDMDPEIHPGAAERCNAEDDDCDREIDEGVEGELATWYEDADRDGYGDPASFVEACTAPEGYTGVAGDCDDADAAYNPGAAEPDCTDPSDYNCDGSVGFRDDDGDGFAACEECDDGDAAINPRAVELCDGVDNNCDGAIDEDSAADAGVWYRDSDGDGYGDPASTSLGCGPPSGYVGDGTDCDDAAAGVNPGAPEVCDAHDVDEDCDGGGDDADPEAPEGVSGDQEWFVDADGDGEVPCANYYEGDCRQDFCDPPGAGWVAGAASEFGDCNDADPAVNTAAVEVCNGIDDDCDAAVDEAGSEGEATWYADSDGDGFGDPSSPSDACDPLAGFVTDATDCDDAAPDVHPGAVEACGDGVDQDCDGVDESGWVTSGTFEGLALGTAGAAIGGCWRGSGDPAVVDSAAADGAQSLASAGSLEALTFCADSGFEGDFVMSWDLYDEGSGAQSMVWFHQDSTYVASGDILGVGYQEACAEGQYCLYISESGAAVSLAAREAGWVHFDVSAVYPTSGGADMQWDVCVTTSAGTSCGSTVATSRAAVRAFRLHSDWTRSWWDNMAACAG